MIALPVGHCLLRISLDSTATGRAQVHLLPANTAPSCVRAHSTDTDEHREWTIDAAMPESVCEELTRRGMKGRASIDEQPRYSKLAIALGRRLVEQVARDGDEASLYTELLIQTLVVEIFRAALPGPADEGHDTTRLSASALRRIEEHVDQNAGEPIAAQDLARLARAPVRLFARMLKRTTGQTPYQFVLTRRIAKARDLILTSALALAQIAYECGFSSQAHMTGVFRTKLGVTPGELRKTASVHVMSTARPTHHLPPIATRPSRHFHQHE
ncbi:MAG: AraC family transcriptional regulator [Pseudomonadota bacterium]